MGYLVKKYIPMRWMKWLGIIASIVLVIACFMTWVVVPSKNIEVSGVDATGTNFGKPGYFHFITSFFFIALSLIPRVWAKRSNLLVTALNLAWAIRNYFMVTLCRGGECPEKQVAVYLIVLASFIMLVSAMLPESRPSRRPANLG